MPKTTSAPTSSSERTIAVAPSTSSTWGTDGAGGGTTCAGGRGALRGGAGTGPLAMVTLLVVAVRQGGNKKPFDPRWVRRDARSGTGSAVDGCAPRKYDDLLHGDNCNAARPHNRRPSHM